MSIFKGWTLSHEQAGDTIRFQFRRRNKDAKPVTVALEPSSDDLAAYDENPDAVARRLRPEAERLAEHYSTLAGVNL